MAEIVKVNSKRALVILSEADLIDHDLIRWVRSDSKGWGNRDFISVQPIQTCASKLYVDEYPTDSVFLAEKVYKQGNDVHVVLRVYSNKSQDTLYNHYPSQTISTSPNVEQYVGQKIAKKLNIEFLDLADLIDNLDILSEEEIVMLDELLSDELVDTEDVAEEVSEESGQCILSSDDDNDVEQNKATTIVVEIK